MHHHLIAMASEVAVFIGANKFGGNIDYYNDLVAFGANTTVALWNPTATDRKGVTATLNKHTGLVTNVKYIPGGNKLLTADDHGMICMWQNQELLLLVKYDKGSVTCMDVVDKHIFITSHTNGDICIHKITENDTHLVNTFQAKVGFYATALSLQMVAESYLLLVAGTLPNLFVYTLDRYFKPTQVAVLPGHEDWIRCLAFACERDGEDYIIASGSQDRYIRLWRLRLNDAIDDSDEDSRKLTLLANKQHKFLIGANRAAISFEALIMGHDDWVTGLQWGPSEKRQLLSSAADTVLMIWEMDSESGIWVCVSRLGELAIKGASTATGASGGFWSCLWFLNDQEETIVTNGKTGTIRRFHKVGDSWDSTLGVSGPNRECTDVKWSPNGQFLCSTSLDQTTRLFAQASNTHTWHEFARPQIHGYDMICMDFLSNTKFVSGGDEKILRVFEMTNSIGSLLHRQCGLEFEEAVLPEAASLPVLGLSNKAANEQMEAGEAQQREEDDENDTRTISERTDTLASLSTPPLEEHLQRYTLFPEIEKLYGHGYAITCCAVSPDGSLIASACKSNNARHAVVRLFDANREFHLVDEVLSGHNLTITGLEFSPDGSFLAVVSRDRQLSLWRLRDQQGHFDIVELKAKAHSRIIWDCAWLPTDGQHQFFLTASRDKNVKLWKVGKDNVELASTYTSPSTFANSPITAVASYSHVLAGMTLAAIGHENGVIEIVHIQPSRHKAFEVHTSIHGLHAPASKIARMAFSLRNDLVLLASASDDSSVRIFALSDEAI